MSEKRYILTLSCKDARGIVAAVTGFLAEQYGFIIESAQFGDASTHRFFMRVEFALESKAAMFEVFTQRFEEQVSKHFGMQWDIVEKNKKCRVLVMVSQAGHCLNDLLYRHSTGQLPIEVAAIVSNHRDWEHVAKWHGIPFYYLPITEKNKPQQENQVLELVEKHSIDIIVLARYMQILSSDMCKALVGRAINIHHSFLPSFKGAKPYHQAFDRGVKIIGATAHYVTTDLDEGPIIEQEIERVDHAQKAADLAAIGRDIECLVLARAVKYVSERRVLLNGKKTVVFR
jgi:formyltetrahydrofolate deformylase